MIKSFSFLGNLLAVAGVILINSPATGDNNFGSVHLILGNPSGATQDSDNADNLLLIKKQNALSYNKSKSIANWVSWQLNKKWLGGVPRCRKGEENGFSPDNTLPRGFKPVLPTDYKGSGFDRGHLTPSADRNNNTTDNCAVFQMTNIIPQSPDVNQGPWEKLERYSRELAGEGKELYIIAGGAGTGGQGTNGFKSTFTGRSSGNKINVPASSWKVILVLDKPELGLKGVTKDTRIIAVNMPHKQGVKQDSWSIKEPNNGKFRYITSVDEIEKLTGYDLFSNVPKDIQDVIEAKIDRGAS
ncbi:DNA/RNA non-specific endonuclease [Anabaena sp. UHCC 0399]|jgi:endonuclease G, mitochondrial|uniref:DNA/RNA non-specific endonuclease n=1 Tax=Anabaena sp. UHCC 0399 TaxID=3110238 RepID=UPI002B2062F6|nr:DNA/RNA non-specific endonuclease [Anabaena sp. UHCC 0399]MEA5567507.1 DNA/RNA non-specific endonuclease [Anabaena sp. UHCC 0399]